MTDFKKEDKVKPQKFDSGSFFKEKDLPSFSSRPGISDRDDPAKVQVIENLLRWYMLEDKHKPEVR